MLKKIVLALSMGTAAVLTAGTASAAPTEILAAVTEAQTDGVAVATAVTLMIFAFAAAKWLRRAK